MARRKIDELIELYDKYSQENYKMSFNELANKFGVDNEQIRYLSSCNATTIIKKNIINECNKYFYLAFFLGREEVIKRLWENNIYTYEDIVGSIRILPPCITKIPKEVLEDKNFVKALFRDNKTITAMINNANYVPDIIREKPIFKNVLIKHLDKVLNHLDHLNNYDYTSLLFFPDYLNDQPLYQEKIISHMDAILDKIKANQSYISNCPKFLIDNKEFINKYVEILDVKYYDKLPPYVITKSEVRLKCNRTNKIYSLKQLDKDGYNADWVNENGELIKFFTLQNNFPITSKDDYEKIYRAYVDSKLSMDNFCIRYGITPLDGFKKFIKRMRDENYGKNNEVENINNEINEKYLSLCQELTSKVINEEITFEDFLNNPDLNFYVTNIDYFYRTVLESDINRRHDFIVKIIDYLDRNSYCLHKNFITFLSGNKNSLLNNYNHYICHGLNNDRDNLIKHTRFKKIIEAQTNIRGYKKTELYSKTTKYDANKQTEVEYIVDDDVIDQARCYAEDNNINPCFKALELLCKRISTGEISYKEETDIKKAAYIDLFISLLDNAKTIEEYLNIKGNELDKKNTRK